MDRENAKRMKNGLMPSMNCKNTKHESRKGKQIVLHVFRIVVTSSLVLIVCFAISVFRDFAIQLVLCIEVSCIEALLDKPAVAMGGVLSKESLFGHVPDDQPGRLSRSASHGASGHPDGRPFLPPPARYNRLNAAPRYAEKRTAQTAEK